MLKEFTIGGLIFFDALDYLTAKIMLPLGGMLTCIFVGIRVDKKILKAELTNEGTIKFRLFSVYVIIIALWKSKPLKKRERYLPGK